MDSCWNVWVPQTWERDSTPELGQVCIQCQASGYFCWNLIVSGK